MVVLDGEKLFVGIEYLSFVWLNGFWIIEVLEFQAFSRYVPSSVPGFTSSVPTPSWIEQSGVLII